jgi:hypothetical protein
MEQQTTEDAAVLDDYLEMLSRQLKKPESHLTPDGKYQIAQQLVGRTYSLRPHIQAPLLKKLPLALSERERIASEKSAAVSQRQSH